MKKVMFVVDQLFSSSFSLPADILRSSPMMVGARVYLGLPRRLGFPFLSPPGRIGGWCLFSFYKNGRSANFFPVERRRRRFSRALLFSPSSGFQGRQLFFVDTAGRFFFFLLSCCTGVFSAGGGGHCSIFPPWFPFLRFEGDQFFFFWTAGGRFAQKTWSAPLSPSNNGSFAILRPAIMDIDIHPFSLFPPRALIPFFFGSENR